MGGLELANSRAPDVISNHLDRAGVDGVQSNPTDDLVSTPLSFAGPRRAEQIYFLLGLIFYFVSSSSSSISSLSTSPTSWIR